MRKAKPKTTPSTSRPKYDRQVMAQALQKADQASREGDHRARQELTDEARELYRHAHEGVAQNVLRQPEGGRS